MLYLYDIYLYYVNGNPNFFERFLPIKNKKLMKLRDKMSKYRAATCFNTSFLSNLIFFVSEKVSRPIITITHDLSQEFHHIQLPGTVLITDM